MKNLNKMRKRVGNDTLDHPDNDALIAELQSNSPFKPFSEESKTNDSHTGKCRRLRIVPNLSHISMSSWHEVLDGRNCIVIAALVLCLQKNTKTAQGEVRYSDSPLLDSLKGSKQGARRGGSEDHRAHHLAKDSLGKAIKKIYTSILHQESYRNSQTNIGRLHAIKARRPTPSLPPPTKHFLLPDRLERIWTTPPGHFDRFALSQLIHRAQT